MTEDKVVTLRNEATFVSSTESLADTKWSALFHEARMCGNQYNGVAVPIRVRDGEIEVGEVIKTRQGEHFHVRDTNWDTTINIGVKSFMTTEEATSWISNKLHQRSFELQ